MSLGTFSLIQKDRKEVVQEGEIEIWIDILREDGNIEEKNREDRFSLDDMATDWQLQM